MRHGKLLMITAAVLSAGAVAALPYQRAPRDHEEGSVDEIGSSALPLRSTAEERPELVTLSLSPHDSHDGLYDRSPAAEFLQSAKEQREPVLEIPEIRRDNSLRNESAAPDLAPTFRPFTETIRLLREAEATRPPATEQVATSELVPIEPVAEKPLRYHTIVDGDTLASLAERFLGDANRSNELLTANRNVLDSPDVLPLGARLVIPAKVNESTVQRGVLGTPHGVAKPTSESESETSDLVPIPAHMFGNG